MGLLDDAIRDHLDLKRSRGSDPTEIARMEREALGPVRRGPDPFEAPYHRRPTCEPSDLRVRAAAATQATQAFDVLGDTPEFLQQTPEHDRLWFEQKPPQEIAF